MDPHTSLDRRRLLAFIAGGAVLPTTALAQGGNTVRVIVNTTAGSGVDGMARAVMPGLAQALRSPVVIENQAGASGIIGLQTLARAPADGNTVGFASSNLVIFPSVLKSVPFDVLADFSPIAILGETPLVLVAHPSRVQAGNAKDFAALLKARPEGYDYASSGSGTILHLATEVLLGEMGVKARHIPYKAATPMLTDTIGGQVDFTTAALPVALPHIRTGALRAIGVYTARRVALAPEIPTFVEQGLPGAVVQSWASMLGPKGMSPALVRKHHDALAFALNDAATRDALAKQAFVIALQSPDEARAMIRNELARYSRLVKHIGLQPQ